MQGRAAAIYGLVFLLVAAGAYAYVSAAEPPEPSLENPEHALAEGDSFTVDDREYTVTGFGEQRGEPTVTLVWADEDARAQEEWEYAADPGGTTVVYDGTEHWVRSTGADDPDSFVLLETPAEDGGVSVFVDDSDNWIVNDGGNYTPLEDYDGLDRVEQTNGSTFTVGEGNDSRDVTVESVTNESVTVSWNEPAENEVIVRQTVADPAEINGRNFSVHVPSEGTVQLSSDPGATRAYIDAHQDRDLYQQRLRGLTMTTVLALVSFALLAGLAFLPRKE